MKDQLLKAKKLTVWWGSQTNWMTVERTRWWWWWHWSPLLRRSSKLPTPTAMGELCERPALYTVCLEEDLGFPTCKQAGIQVRTWEAHQPPAKVSHPEIWDIQPCLFPRYGMSKIPCLQFLLKIQLLVVLVTCIQLHFAQGQPPTHMPRFFFLWASLHWLPLF